MGKNAEKPKFVDLSEYEDSKAEWLRNYVEMQLVPDDEYACDVLITASPHYYGILDYEKIIVRDGDGDFVEYFDVPSQHEMSPKELLNDLIEKDEIRVSAFGNRLDREYLYPSIDDWYYEGILIENGEVAESVDDYTVILFLDEYISVFCGSDEYLKWDCVLKPKIVENAMFLTQAEAREHLDKNYYHYHKDAKTYCMHPWRAYHTSRFLKAVMCIDFEKSVLCFKEDEND